MKRIPVLLLTGFLGSGKTTLLNHLLRKAPERIGVVVNEFGAVSIDDKILDESGASGMVELSSGALCCEAHGDVEMALASLMNHPSAKELDAIIIETTGLADPIPIAKALIDRPSLATSFILDRIITVVDASRILFQLTETEEAKMQIASADVVVLSKTDLVDDRTTQVVKQKIHSVNPLASIIEATKGEADLNKLRSTKAEHAYVKTHAKNHHHHSRGMQSIVLESRKPLILEKVSVWIAEELLLNSDHLPRYKGILWIDGMDERFVFQGVHEQFSNSKDRPWRDGETRVSQVVLIGTALDQKALQQSFDALSDR